MESRSGSLAAEFFNMKGRLRLAASDGSEERIGELLDAVIRSNSVRYDQYEV